MTHIARHYDWQAQRHMLVHARARKAIIAVGAWPWRIRWCKLGTVNEGDNKVRDHESCFWLLSSCRSLRQEESPDANRRYKPGVHRHLLPLMSTVTTTLTTANSKKYLAGLQTPFVPTVTDNWNCISRLCQLSTALFHSLQLQLSSFQ